MQQKDWHMKDSLKGADEPFLVSPKQRRQATTRRVHAKIEDIRERLRTLAREIGPGSQLPTTRDLCILLNTSSATLTAALDLLETEQVLYRKERLGIFVAEAIHQKVIHVIFNIYSLTDLSRSPFWALLWAQILQEIERRSAFKDEQHRFHFICRPHGQSIPEDYITLLNSSLADGCLLIGINARTLDHTRLFHIPHVVFAGGGDIMVQTDASEKVRLGIYGLEQRGCSRIACWLPLWVTSDLDYTLREEVISEPWLFKHHLTQMQLPFYRDLMRQASVPPSLDGKSLSLQDQGYLLVKEVFGSTHSSKPDSIYISDDMLTSGALLAFDELGLQVGKDLQIATLTNAGSPILYGRTEQMITIEYDPADIVHAMFILLDEAMLNGYKPEERQIKLQPRLRMTTTT
jgi:DNA-binding LacI/PurR family transcriptional regulator